MHKLIKYFAWKTNQWRRRLFFRFSTKPSALTDHYHPSLITRLRRFQNIKAVILLSLLFLGGYMLNQLLVINSIDLQVTNPEKIRVAQLHSELNQTYYGKPLWLIDPQTISRVIGQNHPQVLGVRVSSQYPNKVIIAVSGRSPILQLKVLDSEATFLVDVQGLVLAQEQQTNLPAVSVLGVLQVGQIIKNEELLFLLGLLDQLKGTYVLGEITFISPTSLRMQVDGISVLYTTTLSADLQCQRLKTVLEHYHLRNVTLNTIDLRFNRPVVSF